MIMFATLCKLLRHVSCVVCHMLRVAGELDHHRQERHVDIEPAHVSPMLDCELYIRGRAAGAEPEARAVGGLPIAYLFARA